MSLGFTGIDSYEFIVSDLERSRRFYVDRMDFREVARSTPESIASTGEESVVFRAGKILVQVTTPRSPHSRAARYLAWHPDGIAQVSIGVKDLAHTWKTLEDGKKVTFLADPVEDRRGAGTWKAFGIATALGDVQFRFVERHDYAGFGPGFVDVTPADEGNRYHFMAVDHITVNLLTIEPWTTWLRDVLGFEPYWEVEFHTEDVRKGSGGTGLKSLVYKSDGHVRFAANEPMKPNFGASQIAKFVEDHRGPGVQHIAFITPGIIPSVGGLKESGLEFLTTPASYYRALPERFAKVDLSMSTIKEPMDVLEKLGIQIDGGNERYMLQIFMKEGALMYGDPKGGPFFYEIIQRAGDPGFGYGNFRALFESIERNQQGK